MKENRIKQRDEYVVKINTKLTTLMTAVGNEFKGLVEEAIEIFGDIETLIGDRDYKKGNLRCISLIGKLVTLTNTGKGKPWYELADQCLKEADFLQGILEDLNGLD